MKNIRDLTTPGKSRMSIEQSPFQLSRYSHYEDEVEECDKTIQDKIKQMATKIKVIEEKNFLTSIEKAQKKKLTTVKEETPEFDIYNDHRLFRESSGDALINYYLEDLNQNDIKEALEAYIVSDLQNDQKSLNSLLEAFKIEEEGTTSSSVEQDKEQEEALELISTLINQNNKADIQNSVSSMIDDEEILKLQAEVLEMDRKILWKQKELENTQEVDEQYDKVWANLEDLYFKTKTEWWAHKLDISIDSFNTSRFWISVNFKDKIKFDAHLKAHGKNVSAFKYDIESINFTKWVPEYEYLYGSNSPYSKLDDFSDTDFISFIRQLGDVIWLNTRNTAN